MSVNSIFDSKLISMVRANPILYEKELRVTPYDTTKHKSKDELWKSIGMSLGVDAKYCTFRWKFLRDKFQQEILKSQEKRNINIVEKMGFLRTRKEKFTKKSVQNPTSYCAMEAEHLFEVTEDDVLQEAMEDEQQNTITVNSDRAPAVVANDSKINWRRIEVLLDGLDDSNRSKAEKRIVAFLCKCQLKSLYNEDISDVTI